MKKQALRNRDFSATRLSYSRNHESNSFSNLSPSRAPTQDNKQLLCNNCFNRQLSTDKVVSKRSKKPQRNQTVNTTWTFSQRDQNQKNKQLHQDQILKMNEYNLKKIRENQHKKALQKQQQNEPTNQTHTYQEQINKTRQLNEQKRLTLKQDLEKQIALAKQRRALEKKQLNQPQQPFLDPTTNKKSQIELQYKQELLTQIRYNQQRKQQEEYSRKYLIPSENQPIFIKQSEEKRKILQEKSAQNRERLNFLLQQQKEQHLLQKCNQLKSKQTEQLLRAEQQQLAKEQHKKNELARRSQIQQYLHQLKLQIQNNKIERRKEFDKINLETQTLIENHQNTQKQEPCTCCNKEFPKKFLSPYQPNQES